MDFGLSEEQEMLVRTTRAFVEKELYPFEAEVERERAVRPDLVRQVIARALEAGLYAANMPEDLGGGGLDTVSMCLVDRELGRASYALHYLVGRPSNILQACVGDQRERYLFPTIRGERIDCLAMTEPDAGSDMRSMKCTARQDADDWVIDGEKHFISHADLADFVILFAASGEEDTPRGRKKRITSFLIDKGTPGFEVLPGYVSVSHRGYHNSRLRFENCRVPSGQVLGEPHQGFAVANDWLGATRLQVAATCLGRSYRALELATDWAAQRRQFGQQIGKYQGISFKLADMKTALQQAELLTLWAAWRFDQRAMRDEDAAMAKLAASEALAMIADESLQIFGGMGLMEDLPLERIWRDARVERIWEGTSEIQRHIISRAMLRPLGA